MAVTEHISLSELQLLIRERLDDAFPLPYWITAEISELKVNYRSGHCYLELVEKGGDNQVPRAKVNAIIWRASYGIISNYFTSTTGSELKVGMKVLVKVTVLYHELYGLSLVISDIDPLYTLGDMEQQRQETIRRLHEDGVYDMNRSLDLPFLMQRIAVVSSPNAAGFQDFMKELGASGYYFAVELFDAFMQGNEAEESIIAALDRIAERMEAFDVVVVIRGGGSQSDLACFNSYRLCCTLAQFPLPVLTGIGHDKDQSVADLVAAVALKTPTAVAGYLVDGLAEVDGWLDTRRDELQEAAEELLVECGRELQAAGMALSRETSQFTRRLELRLEKFQGEIARGGETALLRRHGELNAFAERLRVRSGALLRGQCQFLEQARIQVESRRPETLLALGFAIVRRNGAAVERVEDLHKGDLLDITLAKGNVKATVTKVRKSTK